MRGTATFRPAMQHLACSRWPGAAEPAGSRMERLRDRAARPSALAKRISSGGA